MKEAQSVSCVVLHLDFVIVPCHRPLNSSEWCLLFLFWMLFVYLLVNVFYTITAHHSLSDDEPLDKQMFCEKHSLNLVLFKRTLKYSMKTVEIAVLFYLLVLFRRSLHHS